jgi:autotransporter-associated beta strand protein
MNIRILLSAVAAILLTCTVSRAASQTWTASVNSNWNTTTANWSGSNWVNGGDAFFNGAGVGTINVGTGITANSLTFNNAGYTLAGGSLTLGGAIPAITANADATISSILTGNNGLTKSGGGTVKFTALNTFTGAIAINAGTINLDYSTSLGSGNCSLTFANAADASLNVNISNWGSQTYSFGSLSGGGVTGGNITINGGATLAVGTDNTSTTFSGIISQGSWAAGNIAKVGTGILTLDGTFNAWGNATVNGGVLQVGSTGSLFPVFGIATINTGAMLKLNGGWGLGTGGFNGNFNTQASSLVINGGTIDMASNYTDTGRSFTIAANGATLAVESGVTWQLNTDRSWQHFGGGLITIANNYSLTLDGSGTGQFNLPISGIGTLTKNGSGTWTLTGTSSCSGATTINSGALQIGDGTPGHDGSITSASIVNNANLIFNLSGSSAYSGVISGTGITTVKAGTLSVTGAIAVAGTLALNEGSALNFCLAGVGSSGLIQITGSFSAPSSPVGITISNLNNGLGSGIYNLITGVAGISAGNFVLNSVPANYACALSASNGTLALTVVASPSIPTSALSAAGTAGGAFSYQIPPVSNPISYGATGLPAGVTLNPATGLISGTPTDPGTYFATVTSSNSAGSASSQLIIVLPPPAGTLVLSTSVPRGYFNNVPESANYTLVYSLNIPSVCDFSATAPSYSVDAHAAAGSFSRVAYYLELQAPDGTLQYVWVSMNPFTPDAGKIGVPTAASGANFQQTVTGMNVVSNVSGVVTGTGLSGSVNFTPATTGSMSVGNSGGTLFGFANWSGGSGCANLVIGGGNLSPANGYSVKSLQVLVLNSATTQTVQPVPDNSLLINPGKGFAEYWGPTPAYTNQVTGVGYNRCGWSTLEPAEGVYDWSWVDNYIAAYAAYGRKFAFGVINVGGTPDWVFKSGSNAQTGSVYPTGAVPMTIPDPAGSYTVPATWDDPVYVARTQEFIAAFGARYNGNPNIAYLDMRDYGIWGEGNGSFGYGTVQDTPDNLQNNFYAPYVRAFPNTQIIGDAWYDSVAEWLVSQGTGIRRDGICSTWSVNGSACLLSYPHAPAVMEYANSWPDTVASGTDALSGMRYDSPGELLMTVTSGRPSYLQLQTEFYDENTAFCQMIGNLMGYHFILQQAVIPKTITAGVSFPLSFSWYNDGVAPLYEPCSVAVALLDANNNVIQQQWLATSNPAGWMPGVVTTENYNVTFPAVPTGYKLAVGLFVNQTDANPTYRLGIQGRTVTGWYILSGPTAQPAATWTNATGGSWQTAGNWSGSAYRNGIDATADFSTLNLTGNATVTLDGNVTVGNLIFGDATPGGNWFLTSGTLTLWASSNAPCITVNNQTATLSAPLVSKDVLTKSGSGTLVISGSTALMGNTVINGGVLEIASTTSLYNIWEGGTVTVNAGATLRVNGWGGYGYGGAGEINETDITDPTCLVLNGGTLEFASAPKGYKSSPREFSIGPGGGTLRNSSGVTWTLATTGSDSVTDNSSLCLSGTGLSSQLQKNIIGTGGLTMNGSGTWTLTGTSSYAGDTVVTGGVLEIGTGASIYANYTTSATVTVGTGATLRLNGWGYNVSGLGQLDTNSARLVINGGTIEFALTGGTWANRGFTIGASGATLKASQGTWWLAPGADSITNNSSLTLTGTSTGDIQMPVIGSGSLFKTGNGEWDIEGANTYTGATTVNAGTLRLSSAAATPGVNSALTLANASGAGFSLSYWDPNAVEASGTGQNVGGHVSIGSLSGGGANGGNVELCSGVLTVGGDNTSTTYAGSILSSQIWRSNPNGIGALTKVGTGTLTLSGANSYKGATTISQGNLNVIGSLSAGSAVSVGAAGILGGTGVIGGPVTVNGTLAPGAGSVGSLAIVNALTLSGTASFRISKSGSVLSNDKVTGLTGVSYGGALVVANIGGGTLAAGDTFTLFASGSYAGTFSSLALPALGGNLVWNTSNLAVNGSIGVMIPTTPPAAPAGLMAVAGNAQVSLSWSVSAGSTGYNVRRSMVSGSNYTVIAANTAANSYTDNAVSNWIPYYYVVSAINLTGEGVNSSQAPATPQSPAISTAERAESTRLNLSGNNAAVTFAASVVGHTYQLQYIDSLISGDWTNFGAPQPGTGTNLNFAAPYDSAVPRRFYRLQIRQ